MFIRVLSNKKKIMIILPVSNLENKKLKRNISTNSPSSVLKSKHLERSKINKSFNHLTANPNSRNHLHNRLQVHSKENEYKEFVRLNEMKRINEDYIFINYLKNIVSSFKKLEFQKYAHEIEALDSFYFLVNKQQFNKDTLGSLSTSLQQIEKYCMRIKEKLNKNKDLKNPQNKTKGLALGMLDQNSLVTVDSLLDEFSIIAQECSYLNILANKDQKTQLLFPENNDEEALISYFIMTSIKLFECLDIQGIKEKALKQEKQSFVWECLLLTNSLSQTPYSTFRKYYSGIKNKKCLFLNLSQCMSEGAYHKIKQDILKF